MRKLKHLDLEYNFESQFLFEQKIKELTNYDLNLLISLHNDINKDLMNKTKEILSKKVKSFKENEIDIRTYDFIFNEFFKKISLIEEINNKDYTPIKKPLKYTENSEYTFEDFKDFIRIANENVMIIRFENYYLNNKFELQKEIDILTYRQEDIFEQNDYELTDFELYYDSVMLNLKEKILFQYQLQDNKNKNENSDLIDLSDTTATEKIIYLQKLGVIDFLRTKQPFISSINSLATVLSAVTGAKSGTIQSMLNAMLSTNVNDKNNPLNSQKPTNKVTKQLIQIGFNVDETI